LHDGFGLWLCARRLYEGGFIRAGAKHDAARIDQKVETCNCLIASAMS
jgi:hypothetical protein